MVYIFSKGCGGAVLRGGSNSWNTVIIYKYFKELKDENEKYYKDLENIKEQLNKNNNLLIILYINFKLLINYKLKVLLKSEIIYIINLNVSSIIKIKNFSKESLFKILLILFIFRNKNYKKII